MARVIPSLFYGKTAQFERVVQTRTIHWKQGSFLQMGYERSQTYRECHYEMDGKIICVFVQSDWNVPNSLKLNNRIQYGFCDGEVFFVLHDKEQHPYQELYKLSPIQQGLSYAYQVLRTVRGFDASWIIGDYLKDLN